ncbi:MAG: hypothetical protein HY736_16795 [Verrucomicrobia bacterium]|nr:hypothetical protein [Verrucomicrobiota bacterium]
MKLAGRNKTAPRRPTAWGWTEASVAGAAQLRLTIWQSAGPSLEDYFRQKAVEKYEAGLSDRLLTSRFDVPRKKPLIQIVIH